MADETLDTIYPVTSTFLTEDFSCSAPYNLPESIAAHPKTIAATPFLAELAEIELLTHRLRTNPPDIPNKIHDWHIQPGVELLECSWSCLPELLAGNEITPIKQNCYVLIIPQNTPSPPAVVTPDSNSLLALKIVAENLNLLDIARENHISVGELQQLLELAALNGLLLKPQSKIVRPHDFSPNSKVDKAFLSAQVFTLQWHITQSCDLHCRHCYDRSSIADVSLAQGVKILDQLYEFCKEYNVPGQVSFTGGNPLLHPQFTELYKEASDRGFMTAILGNPTDQKTLQNLLGIQTPEFFQVSLEGLEPHNDYIRGHGHFSRTLTFLKLLKQMKIFSMVMLTLTRANQDEVLALAEFLRDRVELFTFNRLAMVGEGAALASASLDSYEDFIASYLAASTNNPIMRLKDSLINIMEWQRGNALGGGCAGHGCGAAFNFVSLLPDGQVHACRKLPSPIGNINSTTLTEIYQGRPAQKYRLGSNGCRKCEIRPVCGGCPAVSHGFGKDIYTDIDPYCFFKKP